ncbi:methionyl aminopeptidase [Suillus plorans]|uniref:Methionine aminopeptidase n=1 Tax=Suillus plorans TaxID=116603 RepID=A0A9P7DBM3_9AGAM|nr:methionyl aminopeptidase [Suillus plorans]KAG1786265.1 methionyl aminopeptidase [Suillus plorans]
MIMNKLFLPLLSRLRSAVVCRSYLKRYITTSPAFDSDESREVEDFGTYNVILPEEPFVWGVSHITRRPVPSHIVRPKYAVQLDPPMSSEIDHTQQYEGDGRIILGSIDEKRLRAAATLAKNVRQYAGSLVQPGVTTNSIDAAIHNFIIAHEAYPSPLLYKGFPRSCCTSVNNVVSHGIPDDRPLEDGDIINIDVTVYFNGFHGDTSSTFLVGDVDEPGRDLVQMTNAALEAGINACGPGRPFNGIGRAIHEMVRNTRHSVCPAFAGHGIGTVFHRPPWIYHTLNEEPGVMLPGHCFTIEPALVQGSNPSVWIFPDGWTASTENCARSAQAEHMILITETGVDVLTQ